MINPVISISTFKGENFENYLQQVDLWDIFGFLVTDEDINPYASSVAKYIVWGYGIDSDMLSTDGYNWGKLCQIIFAKANLPEELYGAVVELKNKSVIDSIQTFLDYQNDENWTQYCTYRDLRAQMLSSAVGEILNASEETNYEQKMKNAIHSQTLLSMMNVAKETFIQNHSKLKGAVEAFNRIVQNKEKTTRSPAHYAQR